MLCDRETQKAIKAFIFQHRKQLKMLDKMAGKNILNASISQQDNSKGYSGLNE